MLRKLYSLPSRNTGGSLARRVRRAYVRVPMWLPVPVGICLIAVTVCLAWIAERHDEAKFGNMIQAYTDDIASDVQTRLGEMYGAMGRISARWDAAGGTPRLLWEKDARGYLEGYPFLKALAWADDGGTIRRSVFARAVSEERSAPLFRTEYERAFVHAAWTRKPEIAGPIRFRGGDNFLYIWPLLTHGRPDGVLVAAIGVRDFFNKAIDAAVFRSYDVAVHEKGRLLFSTLPDAPWQDNAWTRKALLKNVDRVWVVSMRPTPALLASYRSPIPLTVLVAGVFASLVIALSLYLALKWRLGAQELRDRQACLHALFNIGINAIVNVSVAGKVWAFNPAAEKLFGYRIDEVIGQDVGCLMPPDGRDRLERFIRYQVTASDANAGGNLSEAVCRRKDGTEFPVELEINRFEYAGKMAFSGVLRDITERKTMERLKNEFISTVSHELRRPLTSISGALQLMDAGVVGDIPAAAKRMVSIAHDNSQRLIRLVNDILDIEKMEAGLMPFELAPHQTAALVERAIAGAAAFAGGQGVRLRLDAPAGEASVLVDADRFIQLVTNLLSNAVKFSPEGGIVTVTVARAATGIRISVADCGPGIPEAFQARLFEKFAQADNTDSRRRAGTGLGLAIVKNIVERMNGAISFDTTPDKGTVFHVDLPEAHRAVRADAARVA